MIWSRSGQMPTMPAMQPASVAGFCQTHGTLAPNVSEWPGHSKTLPPYLELEVPIMQGLHATNHWTVGGQLKIAIVLDLTRFGTTLRAGQGVPYLPRNKAHSLLACHVTSSVPSTPSKLDEGRNATVCTMLPMLLASEDTVLYTAQTYINAQQSTQLRQAAQQQLAQLVRCPHLSHFWLTAALSLRATDDQFVLKPIQQQAGALLAFLQVQPDFML